MIIGSTILTLDRIIFSLIVLIMAILFFGGFSQTYNVVLNMADFIL